MAVINLIRLGKTLTFACRTLGMTTTAFRRLVAKEPELTEMFEEAEQNGRDVMADMLIDADVELSQDPKMAGVLSKNIQWVLERRDRARFGQRVDITHNVTADKAIIDALSRAKDRAHGLLEHVPTINAAPIEDAAYTVVVDDDEDISQFF